MSDFFNAGWSIFVGAFTLVGLVACLALLIIASRRKVMAADNSTGHVWDEDLRELNNPLPRWWMWLFVITVVFALIYLALYPGLGSREGQLQWSSSTQHEAEQAAANARMEPLYARYANLDAPALAKDAEAMGIGQRLFLNNCAQCHGSDARGAKGFPNLTDNDWLYGGDPATIEQTIRQGRQGNMPPMAAAIGGGENVRNVAHYVMSLSGAPHNSLYAQLGRSSFAACAACHGSAGKGNPAIGAPNLSDKAWLHGWGEEAISHIVVNGKLNVMPAQDKLLTPAQIHVLAAYVWQLSHPSTVAAR